MSSPEAVVRVLTPAAVRWAIDTLGAQRVHPTFVMYLYLRIRLRNHELHLASASDPALLRLLRLDGGPPTKPYYFPLIERGQREGAPLASFWRSSNIPGSWAQSSLGRQQRWLIDPGGRYTLPDDHAQRALISMLYDNRVSALAMGAYFLRNDGFLIVGDAGPNDVVDGFRRQFDFPWTDDEEDRSISANDEFRFLFTSDVPEHTDFRWFEAEPVVLNDNRRDDEGAAGA